MKLLEDLGMVLINNRLRRMGRYECECGEINIYRHSTVKAHYKKYGEPKKCSKCGHKKSGSFSHRDSGSKLYKIWRNMRARIRSNPSYKGLGIERSFNDYNNFKHFALESGYVKGLSIDRIDPNRGYFKDNIQFITSSENSARANRRGAINSIAKLTWDDIDNIIILYKVKGLTQLEIANMYKVTRPLIGKYIRRFNQSSTTILNGSTLQAPSSIWYGSGSGVQSNKTDDIVCSMRKRIAELRARS